MADDKPLYCEANVFKGTHSARDPAWFTSLLVEVTPELIGRTLAALSVSFSTTEKTVTARFDNYTIMVKTITYQNEPLKPAVLYIKADIARVFPEVDLISLKEFAQRECARLPMKATANQVVISAGSGESAAQVESERVQSGCKLTLAYELPVGAGLAPVQLQEILSRSILWTEWVVADMSTRFPTS
ncbi:MAG: hypothetical protein LBK42_13205 [Propionibacteriaceae bacterium]|jgi:hypothetical protein|nr:hypothetical protein [Propionibacteriaceae bacterium]